MMGSGGAAPRHEPQWRLQPSTIMDDPLEDGRAGLRGQLVKSWVWRGILGYAASPLSPSRPLHALLSAKLIHAVDRNSSRIPLEADRFDRGFLLAIGSVLAFTLLAYWSLTDYWDVEWFAGEDGVSEWWSVGTYLASATMAGLTAMLLTKLGHPLLGKLHVALAVLLLLGALEEISWGQRLFGWSTPDALTRINYQDETTVHNITSFRRVIPTVLFVGSVLGLFAAVIRSVLHHHRHATTFDFILPSLVLSPALLMIVFWIGGAQEFSGNIIRMLLTHFDLKPIGSEIPEVLLGLCLCLYTCGNLKRAAFLRSHKMADPAGQPT